MSFDMRPITVLLAVAFAFGSCMTVAAQPVPEIAGDYEGSIQGVFIECTDPDQDDEFSGVGILVIQQDGNAFTADGDFFGGVPGFTVLLELNILDGLVTQSGSLSGTYSHAISFNGIPYSFGSGNFTGQFHVPSITLLIVGLDQSPKATCTLNATFSGSTDPVDFFSEDWSSSLCGATAPSTILFGDAGGWFLEDTVSEFPECGETPHRATILKQDDGQILRLTSNNSESSCADNIYLLRVGLGIPIDTDTHLSFAEQGRIIDPEIGSPGCFFRPCGDTVSVVIGDNRGNFLAYILQRHPGRPAMSAVANYREILLDPNAGVYNRNLFDDLSTIPNFNPDGAEVDAIQFAVQEHGSALLDSVWIGPDIGLPDSIRGIRQFGIDRWWATKSTGDSNIAVTWTVEVAEDATYQLTVNTSGEWKLSKGARVIVDGVGRNNLMEGEATLVLGAGCHDLKIEFFEVPSQATVEEIVFTLTGATSSISLKALFVADHEDPDESTVYSVLLDGKSLEFNREDLVDRFAPVLAFNQGERYAIPFDVLTAAWENQNTPRFHPEMLSDVPSGDSDVYVDLSYYQDGVYNESSGIVEKVFASILQIDDKLAINYYFFYPRSNWAEHGGVNTHEGDWEGITVFFERLGAAFSWNPTLIAFAQHVRVPGDLHLQLDGGNVVRWANACTKDGHPRVRVGLGGHASYPETNPVSNMTKWTPPCFSLSRIEQHHGDLSMIMADAEYLPRVAAENAPDWLRYPGKWGNPDRGGSDPTCIGSTDGPRGPVFGAVAILGDPALGERWISPWRWAAGMNEQIACPAAPGTADILWRNENTGQVVIWLLDGTQPIDAGSSGVAGPVWTIADLGDFNADGFQDILWRHDNGQAFIWLMNGTQRVGQGSPGSVGQPWQIAGVGDFDGDRRDDILWRHTVSGQVFIWFIDGTQRTGQGSAGAVSPDDWAIAGVGDFDGLAFTPTSTDDILWRHTATGQTFIWLMDGTTRIGQGSPGSVGNIWQIVGTGDFDGDDHADILWRHTSSGQVVIWQIMGTQRVGSGSPGQTNPADWQIVGIGDFDGDRRDDLLWRHQMTGLAFIWFIDGIDRVDAGVVGFAGLDWSVSGTGNFDGR